MDCRDCSRSVVPVPTLGAVVGGAVAEGECGRYALAPCGLDGGGARRCFRRMPPHLKMKDNVMHTGRMRGWKWLGLAGCVTVFQGTGCITVDLVGQVFAEQVAFTAATIARGLVSVLFGLGTV